MFKLSLSILCVFLLILGSSYASVSSHCELNGQFQNIITNEIKGQRLTQAGFSLVILDENNGSVLCEEHFNAAQNIYPASSIKTLVATTIYRMLDQRMLRLQDKVIINQVNANEECRGNCVRYRLGTEHTIASLIRDMLRVSNNIATNQLIEIATKDRINQTARLFEAHDLVVNRKVYANVNPEPHILLRNKATSAGFVALYREIATNRLGLLSTYSRNALIDHLGNIRSKNFFNHRIHDKIKFYHKTGSTSQSSSDTGFFKLGQSQVAILIGLQDYRAPGPLRNIGEKVYNNILKPLAR